MVFRCGYVFREQVLGSALRNCFLYSSFHLTSDVLAFSFTVFELTLRFLLMKLNFCVADTVLLWTCLFNFKSVCIVTPRYFVDVLGVFFAVHVGEGNSQLLLGFVYLLPEGLSACLDGTT